MVLTSITLKQLVVAIGLFVGLVVVGVG